MKKYILTNNTKRFVWFDESMTLYQIQAIEDIVAPDGRVVAKAGTLGGYVSSEKNLSQEGSCWIGKDSTVFADAIVEQDAQVDGQTEVGYNARLSGNVLVCGRSTIGDNVRATGNALIKDSILKDNVSVNGNIIISSSKIGDDVQITGCVSIVRSKITGQASISGLSTVKNARIKDNVRVQDNVTIEGAANESIVLSGNAQIRANATLLGYVQVGQDAIVTECTILADHCKVMGTACLTGDKEYDGDIVITQNTECN